MLELIAAPDHVVAMRVSGRIEVAEVESAIICVEAALTRCPRVSLYVELGAFEGITPEAIARDLRYGLEKLRQVNRFRRAAVVTDEGWLRALARVEAWLLPSLELRIFAHAERAAALDWVAEDTVAEAPQAPAVRLIATSDPKIFAFEIDGRVTAADVARVTEPLQALFTTHDQVRLLGRVKRLDGIDVAALARDTTVAVKTGALSHVERYALVGGPGWLKTLADALDPVLKMELRHFDAADEDAAWAWLGARPAAPA